MVGAYLVSSLATTGAGIENLIQEAEKRESWGKYAQPAVGSLRVGIQERWIEAAIADVLQVMKGLPAQWAGGLFKWRVKTAKKRSCSKHICLYTDIQVDGQA